MAAVVPDIVHSLRVDLQQTKGVVLSEACERNFPRHILVLRRACTLPTFITLTEDLENEIRSGLVGERTPVTTGRCGDMYR